VSAVPGLGKSRVETLADGVFAIAMTLLVLDLRVPQTAPEGLGTALSALLPRLLSFVLSFALLGIYWVAHHVQFHYIRRTDRPFLWINILFLLAVAIVPFSAALLGAYWREPLAIAVYGANLMGVAATLLWIWNYATRGRRLVDDALDPELVRLGRSRIAFTFAIIGAAVLVSFWQPLLSLALFLAMIVRFIAPGSVDRFWTRRAGAGGPP